MEVTRNWPDTAVGTEVRFTVAILGVGGVGGLLGALLARSGTRVICLGRQTMVDRLRTDGLSLRSAQFGNFTVPVEAATHLDARVDAVLVTVKAPALVDAIDAAPPSEVGDALIVPFLNGIEHVAALRERYPTDSVVAGTIRVESRRTAIGQIEHMSPFVTVQLAARPANAGSVAVLAAQMVRGGVDVSVRTDEDAMLWDKLGFVAPLALLTTQMDAPAGVVRTRGRDDMVACIHEVAQVAKAEGAPLDASGIVAFFDAIPETMQSSMQLDFLAKQPTELDAIGGAVVRAAARHGLQVPVTERLVDALLVRLATQAMVE